MVNNNNSKPKLFWPVHIAKGKPPVVALIKTVKSRVGLAIYAIKRGVVTLEF